MKMAAATLLELLSAGVGWWGRAGNTPPPPPSLLRGYNITKQWEETAYIQQGSLKLKNPAESGVSVPAVRRRAHWALEALARLTQYPEVASVYWVRAQPSQVFLFFNNNNKKKKKPWHFTRACNNCSFVVPHVGIQWQRKWMCAV